MLLFRQYLLLCAEVCMDKQRQEEIIKLMTEKGAIEPCPRCKNPQFELIGEAFIQMFLDVGPPGAPAQNVPVPVIVVACKRCGYVAQHAERILDPNTALRF